MTLVSLEYGVNLATVILIEPICGPIAARLEMRRAPFPGAKLAEHWVKITATMSSTAFIFNETCSMDIFKS